MESGLGFHIPNPYLGRPFLPPCDRQELAGAIGNDPRRCGAAAGSAFRCAQTQVVARQRFAVSKRSAAGGGRLVWPRICSPAGTRCAIPLSPLRSESSRCRSTVSWPGCPTRPRWPKAALPPQRPRPAQSAAGAPPTVLNSNSAAVRAILAKYNVTDITPNEFSQMIQQPLQRRGHLAEGPARPQRRADGPAGRRRRARRLAEPGGFLPAEDRRRAEPDDRGHAGRPATATRPAAAPAGLGGEVPDAEGRAGNGGVSALA